MAISKAKKDEIYSKLKAGFEGATGVSFTKSSGLTVEDISNIRSDLREVDGKMMLAKKTIIKLAFKEVTGKELSDEMLDGQIAVVFANGDDSVAPMGAINKHAKALNTKEAGEKIVFVGAYLDGEIQDGETTAKLASLPSRDTLLAKFMGSFMSPVSGLARFMDGAKTKLDEISGQTVADLLKADELAAKKEEAPAEEAKAPEAEKPAEEAPAEPAAPAEENSEASSDEAPKEEASEENSEAPAEETKEEPTEAPAEAPAEEAADDAETPADDAGEKSE